MMLYFVLWITFGAVGQLLIGIWYGGVFHKIEEKYGLDKEFCNATYRIDLAFAMYKIISLGKYALRLWTNGSKLWIPVAILNNVYAWLIWPIVLPKSVQALNDSARFLRAYGRLTIKKAEEGS